MENQCAFLPHLANKTTNLQTSSPAVRSAAYALLGLFCLLPSAFAANATWNGTTDATWAGTSNWSATPVPGAGDTATFNNAGNANTTIDLGGGVTISNLVFDTASVAAYTIGLGGAGNQTLTLTNGSVITLNSTVVNNQLLNAKLNLASTAAATSAITNNSSALLTIAGGIIGNVASGNGLQTVAGSGNTTITGPVTKPGAGSLALLKVGAGVLTLSTNSVWSGAGAVGNIPSAAGFPLVAREGTLLLNGGTNTTTGELVIGGVVANGGAGQNAKIIVDGGALAISGYLSVGRGNGVGGVSSDLVLTNAGNVSAANFSAGYNGGSALNLPKGTLGLNNSSIFTITGNGVFNLAESPGSDMAMTLNNSAQMISIGTGLKYIGNNGKGTLNINGTSVVNFGNTNAAYIGHNTGTGAVNIVSGTFNNGGDTRVGGSDANGTGINANGTFTMSGGFAGLASLTVARGNNNQNGCSGSVIVGGGTLVSTNDLVLGFAGTGLGKLAITGTGIVNVGPVNTKWLMVQQYDTASGELDITNGQLNLMNGTSIKFAVGNNTSGGTNTVNQIGGAITYYSDAGVTVGGAGDLNLAQSGSATAINTYNLNGGTLTVPSVGSATTLATRIFNFNGGTLKPTANNANFFNLSSGNATANVRDNGAIIDSNGKNITIVSVLAHSGISGDAAIDGGLTKLGNGTLTLAAGNSYTGTTKLLGGTLNLNTSTLTAAGSLLVSNATLALDVTGGGSVPINNLTFQSNAVVNLSYGSLGGNPGSAALNASGTFTSAGTNTLNITGTGWTVGAVPLIAYTGATLPSISNFKLGTLPPGVNAVLVNNTANHRLDLNITFIGQTLTWYGADSLGNVQTNWNVNISTNWNSGTLKFLQYGTSPNFFGDLVTFDDNVFNPQATNIVNLATNVFPSLVTVNNNSYNYSISGSGKIAGSGLLIMNGSGSLNLATSNSYTGGTFINAGTIAITNDAALGTNTAAVTLNGGTLQLNGNTVGSRPVTLTANSKVGVLVGMTAQLTGNVSGTGAFDKNDNGTLTLAGNNSYTGPTLVSAGTLGVSGTLTNTIVTVGDVAGNATLTISGNVKANSLLAGNAAGAVGVLQQTSGLLTVTGGGGDCLNIGNFATGFGYFNSIGGTTFVNGIAVGGENNTGTGFSGTGGDGIMEMNGGTVTNVGWLVMSRGATAETGVLNVFSGTLSYAGGGLVCNWGTGQTAIINVMGGLVFSSTTGIGLGSAGNTGILNLNGGVAQQTVVQGNFAGTFGQVNFNGGTLKAVADTANFVHVTSANIFSNGGTVDDNGNTVTIGQALLAPVGYGVTTIPVASGGAGYIAPPIVTISGGAGSNATAYATITGGAVTALTVTSPGMGYDVADAGNLAVTFLGGGATTLATAGTPTLALNVSGGLVKKGAGTLTLSGANTYTGATVVTNGELFLTPAHQSGAAVVVANGTRFGVSTSSATNGATIGALTLGNAGASTLEFSYGNVGNPTNAALSAGAVTISGTSSIRVAGSFAIGAFPVLKYTSLSGSFSGSVLAPRGVTATVSNDTVNKTIYVVVTALGGGIVWTGSSPISPNLWDKNISTNWLTGATPTTYLESLPPGDAVTFNDVGSGSVTLNTNVSPSSMLVSNTAVNYTIQGSGQINSASGLTKLGTGTVSVNVAANYAGSSVISNGTYKLGANHFIGNLSGSGTVDVSAGAPTLTVSNAVATTYSGQINGALGLTKTGNSTFTLTGSNAFTGNLFANYGTLVIDSGGSANGITTWVSIGQITTNNAILTLKGTGSLATTFDFNVGDVDSATGTVNIQDNATLTVQNLFVASANAANSTASGTVNQTGGSVTQLNTAVGTFAIGGRNAASALGVGIYNMIGGTLTANAGIRVGGYGTGTFNQSGGIVVAKGGVNIARLAGSTGTYNLNGGTLAPLNVTSSTGVNATFNLNGGLLQALNPATPWISALSQAVVLAGGAIIDTVTNNPVITQPLLDGGTGGGLVKLGTGTLYLDGANSYTGTTVVSNGVLAGIGSIAGSVLVKSTGSIGAGDAGAVGGLTINTDLTIQSKAFLRINKNAGTPTSDLITTLGAANYGGTLVVSNTTSDATPLVAGDTFTLFSPATHTGNFSSIVDAKGTGVTYSFNNANGVLTVVSVTASNPTNISYTVSGNTLALSWPADHLGWTLQQQTNSLTKGLGTNWVDVPGSTSVTSTNITIDPAKPTVFYRLKL